jgi:hypothetical protein
MTLDVDSTEHSTLVTCSRCPSWWAFGDSRQNGWEIAARHEKRVHPQDDQAKHAARETRRKVSS